MKTILFLFLVILFAGCASYPVVIQGYPVYPRPFYYYNSGYSIYGSQYPYRIWGYGPYFRGHYSQLRHIAYHR